MLLVGLGPPPHGIPVVRLGHKACAVLVGSLLGCARRSGIPPFRLGGCAASATVFSFACETGLGHLPLLQLLQPVQWSCPAQAPGTVLLPCGLSHLRCLNRQATPITGPFAAVLLRTAFASWGACGKHKPPAALAFGIPPKRQTGLRPDCLQAQPANCL